MILAIAEKGNHEFYASLPLKGKRVRVCSPADASRLATMQELGLLLLDSGSRTHKGLKLLKELKTLRPDVPVVFITGDKSFETAVEAFRSGARDIIGKPINLSELRTVIEHLLKIDRWNQERRCMVTIAQAIASQNDVISTTCEKPTFILRTLQYIEEHLTENIALQDLADQVNLSKYHFTRLFQLHMGMSPIKFVTFLRIQWAKELLRNGDARVKSVYQEVGFGNVGTFLRQFKKHTGMSPATYKRSHSAAGKPRANTTG